MSHRYRMQDSGESIVPDATDSDAAKRLLDFIAREGVDGAPRLVGASGQEVQLSPAVYRALEEVAEAVAGGGAVTVLPTEHELTSTQAADVLNVSRPHLVGLLDAGEIPFHKVGSHRRIRLDDLLAYRRRRDSGRREVLRRLTRDAQDAGMDF
jgi:excisionase family DNA binding protein